jgi:hypothetical protein
MVAYEIYYRNEKGDEHLLGVLPERRKNLARITEKSVLKWGRLVSGDGTLGVKPDNLYFRMVKL